MTTFFADGTETSASAMSFALYTLAVNTEVQNRVREEVRTVLHKHGGQLSFECVQEMTYLDMVLAGMCFTTLYFKSTNEIIYTINELESKLELPLFSGYTVVPFN